MKKKMFATLVTLALALTMAAPTFAAARSAQEAQKAPATQSNAPATKTTKKSLKKHSRKHSKKGSAAKAAQPATSARATALKG